MLATTTDTTVMFSLSPDILFTLLTEPVYTLAEVAEEFKISEEKARQLFEREPGVIVLPGPGNGRGTTVTGSKRSRTRNTYRIPESVARRVFNRLSNP